MLQRLFLRGVSRDRIENAAAHGAESEQRDALRQRSAVILERLRRRQADVRKAELDRRRAEAEAARHSAEAEAARRALEEEAEQRALDEEAARLVAEAEMADHHRPHDEIGDDAGAEMCSDGRGRCDGTGT